MNAACFAISYKMLLLSFLTLTHPFTHTRTHPHTHTRTHAHTHTRTRAHTHTRTHAHTHTCTHAHSLSLVHTLFATHKTLAHPQGCTLLQTLDTFLHTQRLTLHPKSHFLSHSFSHIDKHYLSLFPSHTHTLNFSLFLSQLRVLIIQMQPAHYFLT